MKLKWLGHSAFELTSKRGLNILIDPFIQVNPACPLKPADLHPDIICITHGHADHFGDVVEIARNNPDLIVITNYEISIYLQRNGVNAIGINYGASVRFEDVEIRMLEAKHSSTFDFEIDTKYAGNPGSFLFEFEDDMKEASIAAGWINPKFVIPMHYNTFPSIAQNPKEFKKMVTNCKTLIPNVLETIEF